MAPAHVNTWPGGHFPLPFFHIPLPTWQAALQILQQLWAYINRAFAGAGRGGGGGVGCRTGRCYAKLESQLREMLLLVPSITQHPQATRPTTGYALSRRRPRRLLIHFYDSQRERERDSKTDIAMSMCNWICICVDYIPYICMYVCAFISSSVEISPGTTQTLSSTLIRRRVATQTNRPRGGVTGKDDPKRQDE